MLAILFFDMGHSLLPLMLLLPFLGVIELVELSQQATGGGCATTGGLQYSYLVEAKYISAITVTSDNIDTFTMTDIGKWVKWTPDKDATANYLESPNRNNNRRSYAQTAFYKFAGVNSAFKIAVNNAVQTCDVVGVHVYTNGTRVVQGLEIDAAETGGFALTKIQQTLLQTMQTSGTTNEDSRHEISLVGEANNPSPPTDITNTAIEAL